MRRDGRKGEIEEMREAGREGTARWKEGKCIDRKQICESQPKYEDG